MAMVVDAGMAGAMASPSACRQLAAVSTASSSSPRMVGMGARLNPVCHGLRRGTSIAKVSSNFPIRSASSSRGNISCEAQECVTGGNLLLSQGVGSVVVCSH